MSEENKTKVWKTLESKIVFPQKWLKVIQETVDLGNGITIDDYYLWEEGIIVVCIPRFENGLFLLTKQYRHGPKTFSVEFPAGWVESNEDSQIAMERELVEETGYTGSDFQQLAIIHSAPAKVRGKTIVFTCQLSNDSVATEFDETEDIELVTCSAEEIDNLIVEGQIFDSRIIASWFHYQKKYLNNHA